MQYQIKKPTKLTDTEITDIHNIVSTCNKHDCLNYAFDPTDDPQKIPDLKTDMGLQIRETTLTDKPDLSRINMSSFSDLKEEAENFINKVFLSDKRIFHTVLFHNKIIGMIGIYIEEEKYYIHGFCIDPKYRNRGLGRQTLSYIVKKCYNLKPAKEIVIEVQVDNTKALSLYKKQVFKSLPPMIIQGYQ